MRDTSELANEEPVTSTVHVHRQCAQSDLKYRYAVLLRMGKLIGDASMTRVAASRGRSALMGQA